MGVREGAAANLLLRDVCVPVGVEVVAAVAILPELSVVVPWATATTTYERDFDVVATGLESLVMKRLSDVAE